MGISQKNNDDANPAQTSIAFQASAPQP